MTAGRRPRRGTARHGAPLSPPAQLRAHARRCRRRRPTPCRSSPGDLGRAAAAPCRAGRAKGRNEEGPLRFSAARPVSPAAARTPRAADPASPPPPSCRPPSPSPPPLQQPIGGRAPSPPRFPLVKGLKAGLIPALLLAELEAGPRCHTSPPCPALLSFRGRAGLSGTAGILSCCRPFERSLVALWWAFLNF